MNKAKTSSKVDGSSFLKSSFSMEQETLQLKLELSSTSITHNGVLGDVNEKHFIEILSRYLPNRYAVDSAIIVDSNGQTSDQIDIVIYDNQYTPTLLDQQNHRFVPAEAVYAAIEVKPKINKEYIEYAKQKASSIRKLERTSVSITHAGGTYPPKAHKKIICGIAASRIEWNEGFHSSSFKTAIESPDASDPLDFGLALAYGSFDYFSDEINICKTDNSLAYFIFRLLMKLQNIGTVPAVDWNAYAKNIYE